MVDARLLFIDARDTNTFSYKNVFRTGGRNFTVECRGTVIYTEGDSFKRFWLVREATVE